MAETDEKIAAELENIQAVLLEINKLNDLASATTIELAGVGALLHNFYSGIENILKQVFISKNIPIPSGSYWHRDLLEEACVRALIGPALKEDLGQFLAFRHFFVHGYSFKMRADRLAPMVERAGNVVNDFTAEVKKPGI
jgi:hypothetical protein